MTDHEDNNYYTKRQQKADETAWLFMKITYYILLVGIGYGLGVWIGELLDSIWG